MGLEILVGKMSENLDKVFKMHSIQSMVIQIYKPKYKPCQFTRI